MTVDCQPKFFDASWIPTSRPILSRRQARRMQVFPIGVNNLPEEAEGDDWDLKMRMDRVFGKPDFFEPSFVDKPADRTVNSKR